MSETMLGGMEASIVLARSTAKRMMRGRTIWVAWICALLPVGFAMIMAKAEKPIDWLDLFAMLVLLAGILAPLFMASSMAEEIEDKTFTYLWSRPIPRWSVVVGKLLASFPIATGIMCGAVALCYVFAQSGTPEALIRAFGASAAGCAAICMVSAGFALLVPRAGMTLTYCYLLVLDLPLGAMPFSLRNLSVTHQIRQVAGVHETDKPLWVALIWLFGLGGFWLAIALWRLTRAEFSTGDK